MDFFDEEFNGRVNVPPDIKENKRSIIGNYDLRELLYILVAGLIFGFVIYIFSILRLDITFAVFIGLAFALPILYIGFNRFNGLKFEDYLYVFKANNINSTSVRVNNSDNLYELYEKNKIKQIDNAVENSQIQLNPLSRIVFILFFKKQNNNITNIKITNKDNKQNVVIHNAKKKSRSEQQYIYNSIRNALINNQIVDIENLINYIDYNYKIKTDIFITKRQDLNDLTRISFKTNKLKHYVSGEHINKNLKMENLLGIIKYINDNNLSKKDIRNLLNNNIVKKNKNISKGIMIYR